MKSKDERERLISLRTLACFLIAIFTFILSVRPASSNDIAITVTATSADLPSGTIVINDDDPSTHSPQVTLTLTAEDQSSGIGGMRFSTDGGASWTDWEPFQTPKSITLPDGDGLKEVLYQLRDRANHTAIFSDTITLVLVNISSPITADFNLDGSIDANDLAIVRTNFGASGVSFLKGDATHDGSVDANDLAVTRTNFGSSPSGFPVAFTENFPQGRTVFIFYEDRHREIYIYPDGVFTRQELESSGILTPSDVIIE